VSKPPAYLPPDLASELPLLLGEIGVVDSNSHWKVLRQVEKAFADGYHAGYMRAICDESLRAAAERERNRTVAAEEVKP
jgi:hypothetical protein